MALFDRRLLAYFDDGLGAGSTTLLERIVDYQKDLAEIERELKKYQMLLGDREVQCKIRDPERWIKKNANYKTIKERYRKVAEEVVDVELPSEPEHGYQERVDNRRRPSMAGRRSSVVQGGARRSRASIRSSISASLHRASVLSAGGRALWVQIDTLYRLPQPVADSYIVKAHWLHHPTSVETTFKDGSRVSTDDGQDVCIVRQQLKLEAQPNATVVVITVYSGDTDRQIGCCHISADDSANHDAQTHSLKDEHGRPAAEILLRLARLGSSHDPHSAAHARADNRSSRRLSTFAIADRSESSTARRTSVQQRRSIAATMTPIQEGAGSAQEPINKRPSIRPSQVQVVTQDPVAVDTSNQGGRLSAAAETARAAAAIAAAQNAQSATTTPHTSQAPTPSVEPGPSEFGEEYEEEEIEEEEGVESSLGEEIFEEEEEEEGVEEEEVEVG